MGKTGTEQKKTRRLNFQQSDPRLYCKNTLFLPKKSKKIDCPAQCRMKEIFRFPRYKVGVTRKTDRNKLANKLNQDILSGKDAGGQRAILLYIPDLAAHLGHPFGEQRVSRSRKRKGHGAEVVVETVEEEHVFEEIEHPEPPPRLVLGSTLITYVIRLTPGEEIVSCLQQMVTGNNLQAAYIITCVGSVTRAKLRMADSKTIKTYESGPYEIVSLVGTLSGGGHLHGSFSDAQGNVFGGHIMGELFVFTTAEIVVGDSQGVQFKREHDPSTGWPELVVSEKPNTEIVTIEDLNMSYT